MNDELLRQLIEAVQGASPILWEAAMRRAYTEIVLNFFWTAGLLGSALWLSRSAYKNREEWDETFPVALIYIVAGVLVLIGAITLSEFILDLSSPTYAAIDELMDLVKE
jgi:hypothetical protein